MQRFVTYAVLGVVASAALASGGCAGRRVHTRGVQVASVHGTRVVSRTPVARVATSRTSFDGAQWIDVTDYGATAATDTVVLPAAAVVAPAVVDASANAPDALDLDLLGAPPTLGGVPSASKSDGAKSVPSTLGLVNDPTEMCKDGKCAVPPPAAEDTHD